MNGPTGDRVRLARNFKGIGQRELADRVGVTPSYLSGIEAGSRVPGTLLQEALAEELGFLPSFLTQSLPPAPRTHFRCARTTPIGVRERIKAHAHLFGELAAALDADLDLPANSVPRISVRTDDDVERAAEACRVQWGLELDRPIGNVVRSLERAGVLVGAVVVNTPKVDAISRYGDRCVVMLGRDKGSTSRDRLNAAHECAHLVMHPAFDDAHEGNEDEEHQAQLFASAFLLPKKSMLREFPRTTFIDETWWDHLRDVKRHWGISLAALVFRARHLGLLDAVRYRQAFIQLARWRKHEPDEPAEETPEVLPRSLETLERELGRSAMDVATRLGWHVDTLATVAGMPGIAPNNLLSLPERDPASRQH